MSNDNEVRNSHWFFFLQASTASHKEVNLPLLYPKGNFSRHHISRVFINMRHMWVFWLAGGIYSLPVMQCWQWNVSPWEFTGTFTYGPILRIHLASRNIWDPMCFHTDNWHLAWMSRNTEGKRCQWEIKGGAWRVAFLPTQREMLQLHQMISCPTLKILCAFRVLLLEIKPECCFLKINEKTWAAESIYFESRSL